MKIDARVELVLRDKQGKVIKRRSFRSRSYVIAFLDLLNAQMTGVARLIKDTGGTSRTISPYGGNFLSTSAVGSNVLGIIVGTGSSAVAIADYSLGLVIAHGSTTGTLQYGALNFNALETSGSTRRFTLFRSFTNASGGSITVSECGINSTGGLYAVCLVRDLISGGQAVANGETLTITYTISVTV